MLLDLNSVWFGSKLGSLERLCVRSGLAAGHQFNIFSYEPDKLEGVPEGAIIRDAAEVMPREKTRALVQRGSVEIASDFWRYELLSQGRGYWVDLDCLLLKALDFDQEYVFGREHQGTINSAVLLAPPNSDLVRDLIEFPRTMRRPPWFGPRRSAQYYFKRLKGSVLPEDLPWGTYGPEMLSYFVKKHRLNAFIAEPEIFYPVDWRQAHLLYGAAEEVEATLTDKTTVLHLYNSLHGHHGKAPLPSGSFLAKQFERFGISPREALAA